MPRCILSFEKIVNPTWQQLNRSRNSLQNKLRYRRARFTAMTMYPETEEKPAKYLKWLTKKADLLEEIGNYEYQLGKLKVEMKDTPKHIAWGQLDEKDKFLRLLPGRKRLMDTIRMIAYRAETAMIGLITSPTVDSPKARRLLQDLFVTEADILPDPENKKLKIRVHSASRLAALSFRVISTSSLLGITMPVGWLCDDNGGGVQMPGIRVQNCFGRLHSLYLGMKETADGLKPSSSETSIATDPHGQAFRAAILFMRCPSRAFLPIRSIGRFGYSRFSR